MDVIKSARSGVTLSFQFVSAATSTTAKTFASHVKTICAKPYIGGDFRRGCAIDIACIMFFSFIGESSMLKASVTVRKFDYCIYINNRFMLK